MKNKTFGSALIVAGTTIGAGMLAMPLTSAGMGFAYTVLLLVALWALLSYSGLLFVEIYQKAETKDAGIATLAEAHFGMTGRILATLSLVIFMYAILVVYALMAGDLLAPFLSFLGEHTTTIATIIFVLFFGFVVTVSTGMVDLATRLLFVVKVIAFFAMLYLLVPRVNLENLGAMPLNSLLIISASPIFFTSFGFHVSIPSINDYLDGDVRRLRIAIIAGTSIPLVAYIIWQMAIHGIFSQATFFKIISDKPTLDGLADATYHLTGSAWISSTLKMFSLFALITSFLGVALGLFDCLNDLLKRMSIKTNRLGLSLLTFAPVLLLAFFYRDFLVVLTYAGQMFTFYGLVLPIGMVWMVRRKYPDLPYRVIGGSAALLFALILGLLIINVPFLIQAGMLPNVVG